MCRPMPILPRRIDHPNAAQLHDLVRLRRVRDRIDRDYARPLDVAALASGVHTTPGQLIREFELAFGQSPYAYVVCRRSEPIRNQEAPTSRANLALPS